MLPNAFSYSIILPNISFCQPAFSTCKNCSQNETSKTGNIIPFAKDCKIPWNFSQNSKNFVIRKIQPR